MNRRNARNLSSNTSKSAIVAAAIQDHLLRNLMPAQTFSPITLKAVSVKPRKKITSSYAQPKSCISRTEQAPREIVLTENAPPLTLAEKLGVFQGPKPNLTDEEWLVVKGQAMARGAFADVCPICQEGLGARQEILLSCSHTFHRQCIASLERFAGQRVCPICRYHQYEARLIFDATNLYKIECATRIQAWWRGCLARVEYRKLRKIIPPQDPRLRKRFFENKLSEITDKLIQSDVPDVNTFLSDLDRSVERARRVYRQFEERINSKPKLTAPGDWEEIIEKALNRDDDTCPICLAGLGLCSSQETNVREKQRSTSRLDNNQDGIGIRQVVLLSCSHLFHSTCLESFEHFAKQSLDGSDETLPSVNHVCPLCRTANYEKICVQTLFSA